MLCRIVLSVLNRWRYALILWLERCCVRREYQNDVERMHQAWAAAVRDRRYQRLYANTKAYYLAKWE